MITLSNHNLGEAPKIQIQCGKAAELLNYFLVKMSEETITGDVIDLTERLKKHGLSIHKADFITCKRRIHNDNFGITNQADEYKDYATILRDKLRKKKL